MAAPPYYDINPSYPPPHHYPSSSSPSLYYPPPPPPGAADASGYLPPYELPYLHQPPRHSHPAPQTQFTPEQQAIHTLFVSGLPDDVKAREIHNLFRRRPGFETCQLKYTGRGDQVVAFATFFDHRSAVAAMSDLNGSVFDPETGATLHIELARSNSRAKRRQGVNAYKIIDKRAKVENDGQSSDDGDGGSDTDNDSSSNKGALHAKQSGDANGDKDNSQTKPNEQQEKASAGELPPCSTLFIANLGPNCTEEELKQVLSQCSGFQTLKMRGRGGMPVAFADYKDTECSAEAMKTLQGKVLASSDRGGMHLEYARSKMRKT